MFIYIFLNMIYILVLCQSCWQKGVLEAPRGPCSFFRPAWGCIPWSNRRRKIPKCCYKFDCILARFLSHIRRRPHSWKIQIFRAEEVTLWLEPTVLKVYSLEAVFRQTVTGLAGARIFAIVGLRTELSAFDRGLGTVFGLGAVELVCGKKDCWRID